MTSENVAITSNNGSSDVFVYFEDSQNNVDRYFEMIENLPEYTAYNSIEEACLSIPEDVVVYEEMTPEESLACRTTKKNVVTKSTETGSTYFYEDGKLIATLHKSGKVYVWKNPK